MKPLPPPPTYKVKAARQFAAITLDHLGFSIDEIAKTLGVSEATVRRDTVNASRSKRRSPRQDSCFSIDQIKFVVLRKLTEAGFSRPVIAAVLGISSRTVYRLEAKFTEAIAFNKAIQDSEERTYREKTKLDRHRRSRRYKKVDYSYDG